MATGDTKRKAGRPLGSTEKTELLSVEKQLAMPNCPLTNDEIRFVLALAGVDPPSPVPIPQWLAYSITHPGTSRSVCQQNSWRYMRNIRQKGGLSLLMDAKGLTLSRIVTALNDGLRAEKVERYYYRNGEAWDYHFTPDHARRLDSAKIALFLHGVDPLAPAQSKGDGDGKLTFAEIVARRSTPEERMTQLPEPPQDAEFTELYPGNAGD